MNADRLPPRYHQRMRQRSTILLTGGNRGLGRATAEVLAREGHRGLLTARDPAQGAAARESILAAVPGAAVEVLGLDLGSLDSIRRLAESLLDQPPAAPTGRTAPRSIPAPSRVIRRRRSASLTGRARGSGWAWTGSACAPLYAAVTSGTRGGTSQAAHPDKARLIPRPPRSGGAVLFSAGGGGRRRSPGRPAASAGSGRAGS